VREFTVVCPEGVVADDCIPKCSADIQGDLLLLNMEGDDTKMTCELHNLIYSWIGGAGDGGFIGYDMVACISSVLSHAAGLFSLILATSASTGIALDLVGGQSARIHSRLIGGPPVVWTYTGSGSAFLIGAGASLQITDIVVAAESGLAFRIETGASLSGTPGLESGAVTCEVLATGVGSSALDCAQNDAATGTITLAGPTFVSTSGSVMPLGSVKYLGDVLSDFIDVVYTHEVGLYTLDVAANVDTTTAVPVDASMHVSIVGAVNKPGWSYSGQGAAFTVAAAGFLTLDRPPRTTQPHRSRWWHPHRKPGAP
jgi:hypothetical protein